MGYQSRVEPRRYGGMMTIKIWELGEKRLAMRDANQEEYFKSPIVSWSRERVFRDAFDAPRHRRSEARMSTIAELRALLAKGMK